MKSVNENNPLISVIVPVYNVEPYLDRCVESIVNQTYRNLEIILVDDGSPDNCPQKCEAWAERDARIKVIHKENGGLSDARNAGMAIAAGELMGFVDSDDWITLDFISVLHDNLKVHQADISACDVFFSHGQAPQEKQTSGVTVHTSEEAINDILHGRGFRAVAWNKLYRREIIGDEKYPVGKHHEDEFLTYKLLAKANRLTYVDKPMYCYFQRQGSIMNSNSIKRLDALDAHCGRLAFLKQNYPALYLVDKISYCTACVAFYKDTFRNEGTEVTAIRNKIKECRQRVSFSASELSKASLKQLIYVFASKIALHLFCWVLFHLHKEKQA